MFQSSFSRWRHGAEWAGCPRVARPRQVGWLRRGLCKCRGAGYTRGVTHFPLIVGLGNPGRQYEATRHNVGFMVLDRLVAAAGAAWVPNARWQGHFAKLPDDGTLVLKPQTFMNLSGRSVQVALHFFKIPPAGMLVVHDDAALPLGTLRFRENGSAGGHNGIKSIIQHLGTGEFPRLKIGIGGGQPGGMVGHVLGKFRPEEEELLQNTLAKGLAAVQAARSQGFAAAANQFNTTSNPPPHTASDDSQIPRPDRP